MTTSVTIGTDLFHRMARDAFDAKYTLERGEDDLSLGSSRDDDDDDDDDVENLVVDDAVLSQVEKAIAIVEKKKPFSANEEPVKAAVEGKEEENTVVEDEKKKDEEAIPDAAEVRAQDEETTKEQDPLDVKSGLTYDDDEDDEDEWIPPPPTASDKKENEEATTTQMPPEPPLEEEEMKLISENIPDKEKATMEAKANTSEVEEASEKQGTAQDAPGTVSSFVMPTCQWAEFSKEIFMLSHFPAEWCKDQAQEAASSDLVDQCHAMNERIWKRYFDARCLLSKASEGFSEEEKEELDPSRLYQQELEDAFQTEWRDSALGSLLKKHTYHRATKVAKDSITGELQHATVVSTIFSPFFLPRALQLCMRYHRDESRHDFWCSWHIQFVSLTESKTDKMAYWRPHLKEMWELCSNGYAKMPTAEIGFFPVEEIDTAYLSPNMVRKMRKWLFGNIESVSLFDDITLLKYVMGSCGAVRNFEILHGKVGYTWTANDVQAKDMKTYGRLTDAEIQHATKVGTTWLEYECRSVTSSYRAIDQWMDPYDVRYYKGIWGEKLMEHRAKRHGIHENDKLLRENPHKVWERAERGMYNVPIPRKKLEATMF